MKDHIAPEAKITTDKWTGYQPLKKDFKSLTQIYSGDKEGNFPELHSVIINRMVIARPCYIKSISM